MQQRSEETHAHILEAANRLFSTNGYDATGVAEICRAAGVSKGAFYHHFPSKQALFLELMDDWLAGLDAGFQLARQETTSIPQAIIQMADMVGSVFQNSDISPAIFLEFWTQAQRDPTIWQAAIAPYRRYQEYFARSFEEGIAEGSLQAVDPHLAARTIVSLAFGLLMQALFDPQGADWQKETRQSVELLLKGLSRSPTGL
ncbi:MAG TPA: TetR/AcrR family transcriptional regulator [Anaerolineales bacterium]|nr:TetR/AcrR family transcriptional regulator [Anaerolineales bacterium]